MKRVREEDAEKPVTEGWFKTESVWGQEELRASCEV